MDAAVGRSLEELFQRAEERNREKMKRSLAQEWFGGGGGMIGTGPVVKFELESMKHQILMHLQNYSTEMDKQVAEAVRQFCSSENLGAALKKTVADEIERAVRRETERFFTYGEGLGVIREAIMKGLGQWVSRKE
jgi:hypothetical protein